MVGGGRNDPDGLRSLAVVFDGPGDLTEKAFEAALWERLQSLVEKDHWRGQRYDAVVSPDPGPPSAQTLTIRISRSASEARPTSRSAFTPAHRGASMPSLLGGSTGNSEDFGTLHAAMWRMPRHAPPARS